MGCCVNQTQGAEAADDALGSTYATSDVQNIMSDNAISQCNKDDPIVEAEGVYRLRNGNLVMSRECH